MSEHRTDLPDEMTETERLACVEKARELYVRTNTNDDVQIDDDAKVSVADEGTWVQAWVWVPAKEEQDG